MEFSVQVLSLLIDEFTVLNIHLTGAGGSLHLLLLLEFLLLTSSPSILFDHKGQPNNDDANN